MSEELGHGNVLLFRTRLFSLSCFLGHGESVDFIAFFTLSENLGHGLLLSFFLFLYNCRISVKYVVIYTKLTVFTLTLNYGYIAIGYKFI